MKYMPTLNAVLNSLSTVFILLGFYFVRKGNTSKHRLCMMSALTTSALFLVSYTVFHYYKQLDSSLITHFEGNSVSASLYYALLVSHTVLALVIIPLIVLAVRYALAENIEAHKRIVKWAFPLWLYVSASGVLIYFMLYHM